MPDNTKKEFCERCGRQLGVIVPICNCHLPQSPVSEYYWQSIKQIVDKYDNTWNQDMISDLEVILFKQRLEAQRELAAEIQNIVNTEEDKLPHIYKLLSSRGLLSKIIENNI